MARSQESPNDGMAANHISTLARLSAIERDVQHLSSEIGSLKQMLGDQRTPFVQLAGWASVMMALVAAILYPMFLTDTRLESAIEKLALSHVEHTINVNPESIRREIATNTEAVNDLEIVVADLFKRHIDHIDDGHPESVRTQVQENTDRIVALDASLQREMRDLDAVMISEIRNLDEKLQGEMSRMEKTIEVSSTANKDAIAELKAWQRSVGSRIVIGATEQEARLKALEGDRTE